ncbi:hypothetical protein GCM10011405_01150 [Rufibacter glacialis]|nr:hypothetical protein GCM10011405_01150 [Rufibacter glacialis]
MNLVGNKYKEIYKSLTGILPYKKIGVKIKLRFNLKIIILPSQCCPALVID